MQEKIISSTFLNEQITLKIYLPESYSELYKYNLCIMQDGNDYYQLGRVASLSDELHSENKIENTIFVGIQYKDKYDRQNKYHPDGEQQHAYIRFLAHEVIPFLDNNYSTMILGHSRTLMGDSLAGTLALMAALKYPHTFGRVIMQSPYIDQKVFDLVNLSKSSQFVDIYHTIGENETAVTTTNGDILDFVTPNRELKDILSKKDTSYLYREISLAKHSWKYWQKDLPNILGSMFQKS